MSTPAHDWERIEQDYRAGVLSLREIAERHGLTHGAINKRAKRDSWTRDLSAKIKAKADALVSKVAVSSEVSAQRLATERETVEVNAAALADVKLRHRSDIVRGMRLVASLFGELEFQTQDAEAMERLGELLRSEGANADKLQEAFRRATSLPSRITGVKALADALRVLVALERESWGLDMPDAGEAAGRVLSDTERASRLATFLNRVRQQPQTVQGNDVRH